jgi:solute carrier family 8 (sodium/calcium exchanger)
VQFGHGETNQVIKIPIIDDMEFEKDENFEIELYEPEGGAKLGKINRTAVTITNDDEFNSVLNKMLLMTNANVDSMKVHHETWAQQLKDAMNVNGGDVENASTVIPSKVFFFFNMSFPNHLSPLHIGRLHHALPNLWFQGTIAFFVKTCIIFF